MRSSYFTSSLVCVSSVSVHSRTFISSSGSSHMRDSQCATNDVSQRNHKIVFVNKKQSGMYPFLINKM